MTIPKAIPTFRQYLSRQKTAPTTTGMFITHALVSRSKIADSESWDELKGHLYRLDADYETTRAAKRVWDRYQAWVKEQG